MYHFIVHTHDVVWRRLTHRSEASAVPYWRRTTDCLLSSSTRPGRLVVRIACVAALPSLPAQVACPPRLSSSSAQVARARPPPADGLARLEELPTPKKGNLSIIHKTRFYTECGFKMLEDA